MQRLYIVLFIMVLALLCGIVYGRLKRSDKSVEVVETSQPLAAKGLDLIHYDSYILTTKQRFVYSLAGCSLVFFIGYLFYQQLLIALFLSVAGLYAPVINRRRLIAKRKQELSNQFKQALYALSSALSAGRSLENAFFDTEKDLKLLYPDPQAYIIVEFKHITNRLDNGVTIEEALQQFSQRAAIEELVAFIEVIVTCKRSGGNLVEVIRRTANMMGEKMDIQQDIAVMIAQKKFESRILGVAPLIVIAVLGFSSPDYMQPLYGNVRGILLMTAALLLMCLSLWITYKFMDIKV